MGLRNHILLQVDVELTALGPENEAEDIRKEISDLLDDWLTEKPESYDFVSVRLLET